MNKEELMTSINTFLMSKGWTRGTAEDSRGVWTKETSVKVGHITIVNGQQIQQPQQVIHEEIAYVDEGKFFDADDEETPIWNFMMHGNEVYVFNDGDFIDWYHMIYEGTNPAQLHTPKNKS